MVDHFSTYLYQKRGFYYFSRRVPQEIHKHFPKHRIVLALNTRSRAKALKCAQVICQRLGTLVGLIAITGNRFMVWGDIEKMGPALAVAMLTILYGYIIKLVTIALTKD